MCFISCLFFLVSKQPFHNHNNHKHCLLFRQMLHRNSVQMSWFGVFLFDEETKLIRAKPLGSHEICTSFDELTCKNA